jgi:hypothetical protein
MKRAAQAMKPGSSKAGSVAAPARGTLPALIDDSKGRDLLARADAARTGSPTFKSVPASPAPQHGAERVRLPVTCSARGQTYVVIAERRGAELRFVGNEGPQPAAGDAPGAPRMPARLSGAYHLDTTAWSCPLCSRPHEVWVCECAEMSGALHCLGSSRGRYHCACGKFEAHDFVGVETTEVRGSVASSATGRAGGTPQSGPSRRRLSYDG